MSLKKKMLSGAFWSLLEKGSQQGLSLIVFLLLARILGPEDYGIANFCFIFFSLTSMVTTGLVDGIVSNQIEDDSKLSSLFWGVNGIGLFISILCIVFAKPMAILMSSPQLTGILIWFSIVPLLVSLSAIPNLLLLKELDFRIYAIRSIVSTIIGGIIGIYMALKGYGAYAIVGQQIIIYLFNNIIIWQSIKWRPRIGFNREVFFNEIKPGISVAGVNLLGFINDQLPRFLIGVVLGASSLGFYALATRLRFSLTEMLINAPLNVIYPAISKLSHDKNKQRNLIKTIIYLSGLVIFPITSIAIATADQYVPLFFGKKWIDVIPILQILFSISFIAPLVVIIQQIFRSNNQMATFLKVRGYLIFANISTCSLLFFDNGLILMSIGLLLVTYSSIAIFIRLLYRSFGINLTDDIKQLYVPLLGAISIWISIIILEQFLNPEFNKLIKLLLSILISTLIYTFICTVLSRKKILFTLKQLTTKDI